MKNEKIVIAAIAVAVFFFVCYNGFDCIFLKYFNIICPGCGMTRAVRSLLRLDIKEAFMYHPMVFSMPLILLYILRNGRVFANKIVNGIVISGIGIGFLINYLIKLYIFFGG